VDDEAYSSIDDDRVTSAHLGVGQDDLIVGKASDRGSGPFDRMTVA
jgi:hypothetical protein